MKLIVAALASTLLIGSAYAQSPAPSAASRGSTPAKARSDGSANVDAHINDLHAKLEITPAEEAQWAAVAQAMRGSATELDAAIDKREAGRTTATAVDDLNAYGAIAQAHANGVKALAASFDPLYAAMPDDQKQVADDVFGHRKHQPKKTAAPSK